MKYTINRPLKGMTNNYWIGLETGVAEITVIAHIRPSSNLKYKKQRKQVLEHLIGIYEVPNDNL